ncbi:MAG: hypothetical protein K6E34_01170 [Lachnospiraceae bacterium]|nr:hypothetical protein [Lachnospiraceae bacterium]
MAKKDKEDLIKLCEFYFLLIQWLSVHQEGRTLKDYFVGKGYRTVVIYGMKELGERLYEELLGTEIKVNYVIDRDADLVYTDAPVLRPEDDLPDADVMVVTAVHYFEDIKAQLKNRFRGDIVSLEEIVYRA